MGVAILFILLGVSEFTSGHAIHVCYPEVLLTVLRECHHGTYISVVRFGVTRLGVGHRSSVLFYPTAGSVAFECAIRRGIILSSFVFILV
jgi:hypothetical protein